MRQNKISNVQTEYPFVYQLIFTFALNMITFGKISRFSLLRLNPYQIFLNYFTIFPELFRKSKKILHEHLHIYGAGIKSYKVRKGFRLHCVNLVDKLYLKNDHLYQNLVLTCLFLLQ